MSQLREGLQRSCRPSKSAVSALRHRCSGTQLRLQSEPPHILREASGRSSSATGQGSDHVQTTHIDAAKSCRVSHQNSQRKILSVKNAKLRGMLRRRGTGENLSLHGAITILEAVCSITDVTLFALALERSALCRCTENMLNRLVG